MRHSLIFVSLCLAGCSDIPTPMPEMDLGSGPQVESIAPPQASTAGGQQITIRGRGFQPGATVTIAQVSADRVQVRSPQELTAQVPTHLKMVGRQRVEVRNPDGTSAATSDLFSYYLGQTNFMDQGQELPSGSAPISVVVQDLNGDGRGDLIVSYGQKGLKTEGPAISVLIGRSDNSFQVGTEMPAQRGLSGMTVADVNGDGQADVLTANSTSNSISVLLNQGQGVLGERTDYPVGDGPSAVVAGDFDLRGASKGKADIVVANTNASTLTLLSANAAGYKSSTVTLSEPAWALASGDLDKDGNLDLVYAAYGKQDVGVLLGNGDGTFHDKGTYMTGSVPVAVTMADLDQDGKLDVLVANQGSNTVNVFLGQGNGQLVLRGQSYVGNSPSGVSVTDVDLDGKPDVVVPCRGNQSVSVLLGMGGGALRQASQYNVTGTLLTSGVGFVNQDALPDFVVAGSTALRVMLNTSQ